MPKNIDGVSFPERRRSIRNIPIPESRRRADRPVLEAMKRGAAPVRAQLAVEEEQVAEEQRDAGSSPASVRHIRPTDNRRRKFWLPLLAVAALVLFATLSLFKGATVSYTPRSAQLAFASDTFSASKSGTGLLYSVVKLSGEKGLSVPASGEREVSRKASGTIVVYNDASTEPQTLIATTRFETPEGKVYRIDKAISVPGKRPSGPGSVEATVYADQSGESYNIGLSDFTLPGLKGTARYTSVYARSKTPISGGFVGKEKSVSAEDLGAGKARLQNELSQELLTKAQAEVPADFILFPSLSSVTFEDLPQTAGASGNATINLRGDLYGVMFKRTDLAKALSLGKVKVASDDPVEITSFDNLQVSFVGGSPADLLNASKIDFKVTGQALLVWKTDEVALKSDLAGRKKSELAQILKNYPTVENATASVRPFWKSAFPEDASTIAIRKLPQ